MEHKWIVKSTTWGQNKQAYNKTKLLELGIDTESLWKLGFSWYYT